MKQESSITPQLELFLKSCFSSPNTIKTYRSAINQFLSHHRFTSDEELIKESNIFIREKPSSYPRRYALKYLCEYMGKGVLSKHLVKITKPARRCKRKDVHFSVIRRMASKTTDGEVALLVMLMYETSCRVSAILNLKKKDVIIDENGETSITVTEKRQQTRTIFILNPVTAAFLKDFTEKTEGDPSTPLFSRNYYKLWSDLKKVAKITMNDEESKDFSSHWFRTSRAVHLFRKGYSIFEVQRILGHTSIESTAVYLKATGLDTKELLNKEKPRW